MLKNSKMDEDMHSRGAMKTTVSQGKIWCLVTQIDGFCYSFKFKEDAKGQDVMDEVCNKLGTVEKDYFGLKFTNSRGEARWLNMRNRITRQLPNPQPYSLIFCVKFYVQPHQLLQDSTRYQFFVNVKENMLSDKYNTSNDILYQLYALMCQAESGDFRENHISYNPSRCSHWAPEFRSAVILQHCKFAGMSTEDARYYLLKKAAELEDYGMEYHMAKLDCNNKSVFIGIGIESLKLDRGNETVDSVPYSCLKSSERTGKTVKLDIYVDNLGESESIVYRLNSNESARALYRSITEFHAFYRSDSIIPAIKEQQATRDFFDTFLSWLPNDSGEENYIFDTERTCTEAYDHARRILFNFGASTALSMAKKRKNSEVSNGENEATENQQLKEQVEELSLQLVEWQDSFNCHVCRDTFVDVVLQCGHTICSKCSQSCEFCPFCRTELKSVTKIFLPGKHLKRLSCYEKK